jgi:mannitol-specific phosphotransferase system IIBC component
MMGLNFKKTNLSIVDIASLVKLRVVHTQKGHVQPIRGSNVLTCITGFDSVSGRAVLANKTKADNLAHLEVTATLVNLGVGHRKLVTTIAQQTKNVNKKKPP